MGSEFFPKEEIIYKGIICWGLIQEIGIDIQHKGSVLGFGGEERWKGSLNWWDLYQLYSPGSWGHNVLSWLNYYPQPKLHGRIFETIPKGCWKWKASITSRTLLMPKLSRSLSLWDKCKHQNH